jgi:hypothetical protein
MIDLKHLELMYQQWIQGNASYVYRWGEFVKLASMQMSASQQEITDALTNTHWFKKVNND